MKNYVFYIPIVFVGILGVVGIFEDISALSDKECLVGPKLYLKYYIALLGSLSYAIGQFYRNKNNV